MRELTIACPCTKDALLLQRKRHASAISWEVPILFMGAMAIAGASAAAKEASDWVIGVLEL